MSQPAHADPSHGPEDEIAAARARWSAPASRTGAASGPQAVLLGLQASAGNAAVVGLLRSRASSTVRPLESPRVGPLPVASHAPTAPVLVSREEDEDAPSDEQQGDPGQVITGFEGADTDTGAGEGSASGESAPSADSAAGASADEGTASAEGSSAEGESGEYGESAASGESGDAGESGAYGESAASGESGDAGESAAEGEAGDSGDSGESAASGESEEGDGGDQEHSAEEQAEKEAEGETGSEADEIVASGGGAFPIAAAGVPTARFVDGGRAGTIPFTEAQLDTFDPDHDRAPHAFAAGGRTGTKAWAGGGGAGPKGNQASGSIQNQVVPDYDSSWGGLFSNASAWVIEGTGIADVTRNYVTSDAGDQGNGWWISDKAASALEAHEQRHIANSKELYDQKVQPVLDRIANSRALGADKTYKSSDAKALLKQQIGWKGGLEAFVENDQANNAPNMIVDTNDTASGALPRPQHGPRKIGGKDFDNYLVMLSEPDPT